MMLKSLMISGLSAGLAILSLSIATPTAEAATTATFYDDAGAQTGATFSLSTTVDNAFEVLAAQPGVYDSTPDLVGQMFTVHPPNDASELAFVNNNLAAGDSAFTSNGTKDDSVGSIFTTSAAYVLLKIGGGNTLATALIRNISGGSLTLTFSQFGGGSGLSHINKFGSVSSIPVPAGLILLLTGLGGLGLMSCTGGLRRA